MDTSILTVGLALVAVDAVVENRYAGAWASLTQPGKAPTQSGLGVTIGLVGVVCGMAFIGSLSSGAHTLMLSVIGLTALAWLVNKGPSVLGPLRTKLGI